MSEEAFARVERELEVQQRVLDERFESVPNPGVIQFTEPADEDVLAHLDAALGIEVERDASAEPLPAIEFVDDRVAHIE